MPRTIRWAFVVFVVAFAAVQFARPDRTNPQTAPSASLQAVTPPNVKAILDLSCRDCHSNETRWPWYTSITPFNWLVATHVHTGREHFNFSQWTSYSSDDRDKYLASICNLTTRGRMPLPSYLLIHREATLTPADVTALCTWSEKMRDTLQ
jgi:hypothetical protein